MGEGTKLSKGRLQLRQLAVDERFVVDQVLEQLLILLPQGQHLLIQPEYFFPCNCKLLFWCFHDTPSLGRGSKGHPYHSW